MIIEEKNIERDKRIEKRKIFNMLRDVKLPEEFKFVYDCVEIRYVRFWGLINEKICEINLNKDNSLSVKFYDEIEMNRLRDCFKNSKTKFKLSINGYYNYY